LFAEGAFWQQHPFRDPEPDYLARVFGEEESAECQFGTPIVDGDRAAVTWTAHSTLTSGDTEDLAGVSLLRFKAEGLVVEERDFYNEVFTAPQPHVAGGRMRAAVFCRSLSMAITARRTASAAVSWAGSTPSRNSRLSAYITATTARA